MGFEQGLQRSLAAAGVQRRAPLRTDEFQQRVRNQESVVLCTGAATLALLDALALQAPSNLAFSWAGSGGVMALSWPLSAS